jgi:hypothetical protein
MPLPPEEAHRKGQLVIRAILQATNCSGRPLQPTEIDALRLIGLGVDTLLRPGTHNERAPLLRLMLEPVRENDLLAAERIIQRQSRLLRSIPAHVLDAEYEREVLKWALVELKDVDPLFSCLQLQLLKQALLGLKDDDPTACARALATLARATGALAFNAAGGSDANKQRKFMGRIRSARSDRKKRTLPTGPSLSNVLPPFEARSTAIDDVDRDVDVNASTPLLETPVPEKS